MSSSRLSADLNRPLDELIQEHRSEHRNQKSSPRKEQRGRNDMERIRKPDSRRRVYRSPPRQSHSPFPYSARPDNYRNQHHSRNTKYQRQQQHPQSAIRINNLHYEVSEKDLKELFESIGPVHRALIDYDRAGRSNGSATVHFYGRDDAYRARERFQNVPLDGKAMQIEVLRSHPQRDHQMSMELDAEMDRYMMAAPHNHHNQNSRSNQRYYNSDRMQID